MCETRYYKGSSQNKREGNWDNNRGGRRRARARGGGQEMEKPETIVANGIWFGASEVNKSE